MREFNYNDFVESVKKEKYNISSFKYETQKLVAIHMWRYIRDHLDELYNMLTDEEIDSGDIDYGYEALVKIKKDFSEMFEKDTGIHIDWENNCILCDYYSSLYGILRRCINCPLQSCNSLCHNPYYTLVKYIFHGATRHDALSAVYNILDTIYKKKFNEEA